MRLGIALRWVSSRLNESEVLVISSTKTAADEFARQISGPGSLGLHCLSITQVASELALLKSAELGLAPLSRLGPIQIRNKRTSIAMMELNFGGEVPGVAHEFDDGQKKGELRVLAWASVEQLTKAAERSLADILVNI